MEGNRTYNVTYKWYKGLGAGIRTVEVELSDSERPDADTFEAKITEMLSGFDWDGTLEPIEWTRA